MNSLGLFDRAFKPPRGTNKRNVGKIDWIVAWYRSLQRFDLVSPERGRILDTLVKYKRLNALLTRGYKSRRSYPTLSRPPP
jgi:hypothetical protein